MSRSSSLILIIFVLARFPPFGFLPAYAQDHERIYQKALEYEKAGNYETALAAYQIILNHYPSSPRIAEVYGKIPDLEKRIADRLRKVSPLASIQQPKLHQGRRVQTALEAGMKLPAQDEHKLEELTVKVMAAFNLTPTSNLSPAKNYGSGKPMPVIEKIYIPPYTRVDEPIFVKIIARNGGADARQGGITISFPDKPDYINVFRSSDESTTLSYYPENSRLFSGARQAYIMSTDPMIETYHWSKIPSNGRYSLATIIVPAKPGLLRLVIRTALRGSGKDFYNYPSTGTLDQQSYNVLEVPVYVE